MELEEHGDQNCNNSIQHECDLNEDVLGQSFLFDGLVRLVAIEHPLDRVQPGIDHSKGYEVCDNENVDQQQDKEFSIPEANTVVDPRTMMVHVEHTTATARAMVTPLRLEDVAHQTVSSSLMFCITKMKSPKYRYLTRICEHRLHK